MHEGGVDVMLGTETVLEDLPLRIPDSHCVRIPSLSSHYVGAADFDVDAIFGRAVVPASQSTTSKAHQVRLCSFSSDWQRAESVGARHAPLASAL